MFFVIFVNIFTFRKLIILFPRIPRFVAELDKNKISSSRVVVFFEFSGLQKLNQKSLVLRFALILTSI